MKRGMGSLSFQTYSRPLSFRVCFSLRKDFNHYLRTLRQVGCPSGPPGSIFWPLPTEGLTLTDLNLKLCLK